MCQTRSEIPKTGFLASRLNYTDTRNDISRMVHHENMSMKYIEIFKAVKTRFLSRKKKIFLFAQNVDCGYTKAVLMSTNNLCFVSKIRKIGIPQSPVHPNFTIHIKVGFKGVYISLSHVFLMTFLEYVIIMLMSCT